MYWYYKYPLIIILIALLFGCCVFAWRSCVSSYIAKSYDDETEEPAIEESAKAPEAPAKPAVQKPQERPSKEKPALPPKMEAVPENVAQTINEAEAALKADNPKQARELAYTLLDSGSCAEYSKAWFAVASIIDRADKIFMSGKAPCVEKKSYTVVSGDSLDKIARKLNTTTGAIQRLNALKSTTDIIHPGQLFQYIDGTWSIKVSKTHFVLVLYLNDKLYRIYRVSIGRQDRTPVGQFIIRDKTMFPAWTPSGQNIPYGDPRNILGTRWMALQPVGDTDTTLKGYGIHGTTEPDTIGTAASQGCVRMLNDEVDELFDFVPDTFRKNPVYVTIEE
ncbi:MAG: L,D-transpeptidase family protein [Victivallales bacterium]|nr:L,D-transpeptidase family protein [Victivallales bacterium]